MMGHPNGERPDTGYYPHLFKVQDGRLLLGGPDDGESALLEPSPVDDGP